MDVAFLTSFRLPYYLLAMEGAIGILDLINTSLISDIDDSALDISALDSSALGDSALPSMTDIGLTFQGPDGSTFTASSEAEYASLVSQLLDCDLSALACDLAGIYLEHTSVPSSTSTDGQAITLSPSLLDSNTITVNDQSTLTSALSPNSSHESHSPAAPTSSSEVSGRVHNHRPRLRFKPYTIRPSPPPVPREYCGCISIDTDKLYFGDHRSMSLFQRYEAFKLMRNVLMNLGLKRGSTWKSLSLITVTYCNDKQETLTDILQSFEWRERTWNDKVAYFEWAEDCPKWSWNYEKYPSSPMVHGADYGRASDLYNHWQRIKFAWDYPGYFTYGIDPRSKSAGGSELEVYTAELIQDTLKTKRRAISACLIEAAA
ncbi:hypothetical protein C8R42DRAFT_639948 [Lentinula raphanica]|nr:hypothetical protein C8R42DRAFT_639948 [Lentinula raphanica]